MTSALIAVDAAADFKKFSVTVASNGSGGWGYLDSVYGSISPPSYGTSGGSVGVRAAGGTVSVDFSFQTIASVAQTWFTYILVQDSTGAWRRYTSATATYTGGAPSAWAWGSGSNQVWSGVSTQTLLINPYKA
jgi:hypothetical protein